MGTLYADLALDPSTMDLDVRNGLRIIDTNLESLRQRLYLRFNIWQRAWYFDETFGFPFADFLSKKVLKAVLDNKIKEACRSEPDVRDVINFKSVMDAGSRSYQAFFDVITVEDETISLAFVGLDGYTYPTPDDGQTSLCNDEGWLVWAEKLYYLINFRLPRTGDATWWNSWSGENDLSNPIPVGSIMTRKQKKLLLDKFGNTLNRNNK